MVASLWSVDDPATAKLMTSYYKYLKQGKNKAEALSLAKRRLRRQGYYKNPSTGHRLCWWGRDKQDT